MMETFIFTILIPLKVNEQEIPSNQHLREAYHHVE